MTDERDPVADLLARYHNGRFITWMDALVWCDEAVAAIERLMIERDEAKTAEIRIHHEKVDHE